MQPCSAGRETVVRLGVRGGAMGERPMVTTLLGAMARGEAGAQGELYAIVYDELRVTAHMVWDAGALDPGTAL